jgi:MFS family permease
MASDFLCIVFGGFLIIGGKLSDQIGRKKMFLLGALIFMLTSLGLVFLKVSIC